MKNQFIMKIVLLFSLVFISSCNSDETNKRNDVSAKAFNELMGNEIGTLNKGEVLLDISNEKLLSLYNFQKLDENIKSERFEVVKFDSKNYIRFYNNDKSVSTIALIENKSNKKIILGQTECTSVQCATGGGCLPNGDYCTKCVPEGAQPGSGITGDCKRKTIG